MRVSEEWKGRRIEIDYLPPVVAVVVDVQLGVDGGHLTGSAGQLEEAARVGIAVSHLVVHADD